VFRVWSSGGVAAAMPKFRKNDSFIRRQRNGGSVAVLPHNRSPKRPLTGVRVIWKPSLKCSLCRTLKPSNGTTVSPFSE
jgi:hypothetical protein